MIQLITLLFCAGKTNTAYELARALPSNTTSADLLKSWAGGLSSALLLSLLCSHSVSLALLLARYHRCQV
ncbi:unnamed protein product [Merluccius merluccius]